MFTSNSTLEEDQETLVYFFLYLLRDTLEDEHVEKDRLCKAFGFAAMVTSTFRDVKLEFCVASSTNTSPVFEGIIDKALSIGYLENVRGEESFVFTEKFNKTFAPTFNLWPDGKIKYMICEASKLAIRAYQNKADFLKCCREMVPARNGHSNGVSR